MKTLFPKLATLGCFLLLLGALVASASRTVDQWILALDCIALLVGSAVLIVRNLRQRSEKRGFHFGQLALLPRAWQRWILDEEKPEGGVAPDGPRRLM